RACCASRAPSPILPEPSRSAASMSPKRSAIAARRLAPDRSVQQAARGQLGFQRRRVGEQVRLPAAFARRGHVGGIVVGEEQRLGRVAEALFGDRVNPRIRLGDPLVTRDRKSTRLNSSHVKISYAVFCLKKKSFQSLET